MDTGSLLQQAAAYVQQVLRGWYEHPSLQLSADVLAIYGDGTELLKRVETVRVIVQHIGNVTIFIDMPLIMMQDWLAERIYSFTGVPPNQQFLAFQNDWRAALPTRGAGFAPEDALWFSAKSQAGHFSTELSYKCTILPAPNTVIFHKHSEIRISIDFLDARSLLHTRLIRSKTSAEHCLDAVNAFDDYIHNIVDHMLLSLELVRRTVSRHFPLQRWDRAHAYGVCHLVISKKLPPQLMQQLLTFLVLEQEEYESGTLVNLSISKSRSRDKLEFSCSPVAPLQPDAHYRVSMKVLNPYIRLALPQLPTTTYPYPNPGGVLPYPAILNEFGLWRIWHIYTSKTDPCNSPAAMCNDLCVKVVAL